MPTQARQLSPDEARLRLAGVDWQADVNEALVRMALAGIVIIWLEPDGNITVSLAKGGV